MTVLSKFPSLCIRVGVSRPLMISSNSAVIEVGSLTLITKVSSLGEETYSLLHSSGWLDIAVRKVSAVCERLGGGEGHGTERLGDEGLSCGCCTRTDRPTLSGLYHQNPYIAKLIEEYASVAISSLVRDRC